MLQLEKLNKQRKGKANIRLLILLGLLVLVGAAFLYDKYALMPDATEKINKVINDVTLSLNDGNRKQVEEIVGIQPSNKFQHGKLEVVQYRFPRGLPFYPRPILDVAYDGNAIAHVKGHEITAEWLDQNKPTMMIGDLDRDNRDETKVVGVGGGGRRSAAGGSSDQSQQDDKGSGDKQSDDDKDSNDIGESVEGNADKASEGDADEDSSSDGDGEGSK